MKCGHEGCEAEAKWAAFTLEHLRPGAEPILFCAVHLHDRRGPEVPCAGGGARLHFRSAPALAVALGAGVGRRGCGRRHRDHRHGRGHRGSSRRKRLIKAARRRQA